MQRSGLRFTIASMMIGTAIIAILSWVVTGLVKDGLPWLLRHAIIVLVVLPLLFSMTATFLVALVQWHRDGRPRAENGTVDGKAIRLRRARRL